MLDFSDKLILVVGASSGIGEQTAITLSRQGAKLVLIARRKDKLKEVLGKLDGEEHAYVCADVRDIQAVSGVIDGVVAERGRIDGMVYAAGISEDIPLHLLTHEKLMDTFMTNYFGFMEYLKQVCKRGRYNQGMRIVAISSISSLRGEKAHADYCGSKGAMDASIRSLAHELASKGICINSVAPAMIHTSMYDDFLTQNGVESTAVQKMLTRQYLGVGKVEDVANAITFLLSQEARFITGITLPVDGGATTSGD